MSTSSRLSGWLVFRPVFPSPHISTSRISGSSSTLPFFRIARVMTVDSGGNGYISILRYDMADQCGQIASYPSGSFDINESFLNDWISDYTGNNWTLPTALTAATQGLFAGRVGSWCSAGACTPAPEPPQSPLTQVKVFHGSQCLLVGSSSIGKGIPVQADAQEHWQDHGTHENIVSPVPPGTAACPQ